MSVSTHVLDLVRGGPAAGVAVALARLVDDAWTPIVDAATDADGRVGALVPRGAGEPGTYKIRFDTGAYFATTGTVGFYPYVEVVFTVVDGQAHHHVPLLLGPYGYSTYRGS